MVKLSNEAQLAAQTARLDIQRCSLEIEVWHMVLQRNRNCDGSSFGQHGITVGKLQRIDAVKIMHAFQDSCSQIDWLEFCLVAGEIFHQNMLEEHTNCNTDAARLLV